MNSSETGFKELDERQSDQPQFDPVNSHKSIIHRAAVGLKRSGTRASRLRMRAAFATPRTTDLTMRTELPIPRPTSSFNLKSLLY
ncbi:uncharacterized protein METZ01_LOCUS97691 [marine metagenome]|uniref:Uncharacterized protein n=1 Tax=marine metagenome TaxID=408172 RepID=A0A381VYY1_9ZZZZ